MRTSHLPVGTEVRTHASGDETLTINGRIEHSWKGSCNPTDGIRVEFPYTEYAGSDGSTFRDYEVTRWNEPEEDEEEWEDEEPEEPRGFFSRLFSR